MNRRTGHVQARAFFRRLLAERLLVHNINLWRLNGDDVVVDVDITSEVHTAFYFSSLLNGWGNADLRALVNGRPLSVSPRDDTAALVRLVKRLLRRVTGVTLPHQSSEAYLFLKEENDRVRSSDVTRVGINKHMNISIDPELPPDS